MSIQEEREAIWADHSPAQDMHQRLLTSTYTATTKNTTSTKRKRSPPPSPTIVSESQEDDVEELLGLREAESSYDPWTMGQVNEIKKAMKTSESSVLRAILAMQDKRFKALWLKLECLSGKLESAKKLEGMVNFQYAWIKSAETAGVHKLPPRF